LQAGLTADQILDRMDEASDRVNAGSLIAKVRFDNAYADGTTTSKVFGILARPGESLIYQDLGAGITTAITFIGRWRPDGEIPDGVFQAENLSTFDPAAWGLIGEG